MKLLFTLFLGSYLASSPVWLSNMDEAKTRAMQSHKYILLNFSGSDWCVPCIQMHKEVFESEVFENYAKDNLVLVNADFPPPKKERLGESVQRFRT